MNKKYLHNPFNALYQDNTLLSDKPEIKELNQYALDLEDRIAGESTVPCLEKAGLAVDRLPRFNLNYLTFEFAYNQLGFVCNGLLLAKIKFLKLYKNYGDGTFARARGCGFPAAFMSPASFCKFQLRKQRWQINDTIKAARVVLDLMYAGFEILPTNIAQAVALAKLTIDELIEKWRSIIETIPLDKITAHSIRNVVKPITESEPAVATIEVPAQVHHDIHREAAYRGLTVGEFLKIVLGFFLESENSHSLQPQFNTADYIQKAHRPV